MPLKRSMPWRALTVSASPRSLTISSECPIDWISMPWPGVVDRAHDVAHLIGARADARAHEAVGRVDRLVGLVLVGERDAALAQGALERVQRGVRVRRLDDAQAQHELPVDGLAVEREAGGVVAAVAHGLAHVDEVSPDRAARRQLDAADPAHSADLLGLVVLGPGQALERVGACCADVIMNECAHARGVRLGKCVGDRSVLGGQPLDRAGRQRLVREQPLGGAVRPDRVERAHDEPVAARRAERVVEVAVGLEAAARSIGETRQALHRAALLRVGANRRKLGRGGLEQLAQLVQLAHVAGSEALHDRAAPGHETHEALALEQMQRLAHRACARRRARPRSAPA